MSHRFASSATVFLGSIRFLRNFSSLLRRFLRRLAHSRSGYVPELPTFRREFATSCTGVASTGCIIATFAICDAVHDRRGRLHYLRVTKEELENVALESTRTIEIDEFVAGDEIDPRYIIRPYYVRPDGKVGHDAFAVMREMNKVAIGRGC
jgi:hypothetical protein